MPDIQILYLLVQNKYLWNEVTTLLHCLYYGFYINYYSLSRRTILSNSQIDAVTSEVKVRDDIN